MLVGDNVEVGVYKTQEALKMSNDMGLDLVMIDNRKEIPVCKIMDYKKFLFKKNKIVKPQKSPKLKTIRLRPNTDGKDLETKTNNIVKFLKKGHKVKLFVFFKGREHIFRDKGKELLLNISLEISDLGHGSPESLPKMEGRNKMIIFIKPNKRG